MSSKILLRRGTAAQWSSANPILGNGELGIETDTLKIKIGNGTSTWSQLTSYANVTPSQLTSEINNLINAAPATLDTLNELAAAINNDASFSTTVNNLLTGKVSKSGGDTITSATASTKGLVIKGASSQTASLLEWQDSSGNILGRFHPTAGLLIPGLSNTNGGTAPYINFNTTNFALYPNLASNVGLIIQGAALQTGDLQVWQDTYGNKLSYINANGQFISNVAMAVLAGNYGGYVLNIQASNPSYKGILVKGAASQTANLQEWQNSSGTVLANIRPDGTVASQYFDNPSANGAYIQAVAGSGINIVSRVAGAYVLRVQGATSQTANLQEWQNSSGTVLASIDSNGQGSFKSTTLTASSSGGSSLTLVAASGQTAPLLTTAGGAQITAGGNYFKAPGIEATYVMNVTSGASGVIPFTVKGAASQTSDLTQWTDNSNNLLAKITYNGEVRSSLFGALVSGKALLYTAGDTNGFRLDTNSAANKGLVIKGASSQTADLQQWQDSSANVLAKVDYKGVLRSPVAFGDFWGPVWETVTSGVNDQTWKKLVVISLPDNYYSGIQFKIDIYNPVTNFGSSAYPEKSSYTVAATRAGGTSNDVVSMYLTGPEGDKYIRGMKLSNGTYEIQFRQPADWQDVSVKIQPKSAQMYLRGNSDLYTYYPLTTGGTEASTGGTVYTPVIGGTDKFSFVSAQQFTKIGGTSSQFLKADGSVDSSTYVPTSSSYIAGHHPEGRFLASAALMNDLGNARLRGSTFTFTNVSPSNADIDKMFDGTAGFWLISTTGQTFPIVIEFTLPRTLAWGTTVGIGFGNGTWRANSVKIEAFSEGAWVTCIDTTTNTSEDILVGIPGNLGTGTTKLRYTLSNPNSTQLRICHLWAYNYNSDMWSQLQMPRSGGTMYGSLSLQGILNVNTTGTGSINLGDGAIVKAPGTGFTFNSDIVTINGKGLYSSIGSFTNTTNISSVPLTVKGISGQTANLQEWQNSSGTVLAKVVADGTSMLGAIYTTYGPHKIYGSLENWGTPSGVATTSILAYGSTGNASLIIGVKNTDNANNRNWQFLVGGGGYAGQSGAYVGEGGLLIQENNPNDSSSVFRAGFRRGGQFALGGINTYSASLSVTPLSTSTTGLVIRGIASQTSNLQEWQASDGSVIASISTVNSSNNSANLFIGGGADWKVGSAELLFGRSGAIGYIYHPTDFTIQSVYGGKLIVKAAASQTANLQEWQNSSGTALVNIDASGNLTANNTNVGGNLRVYYAVGIGAASSYLSSSYLAVQPNFATDKGLVIRGAASQTADLQQWQNSSGTVLAKVTSAGALDVTGITVNGAAITTPLATPTVAGTIYGFTETTINDHNYNNNAYGLNSLSNTTYGGSTTDNSAFGSSSLRSLTTGTNNSAFGSQALKSATAAANNSAFGYGALYSTTGSGNIGIGVESLYSNINGMGNLAVGNSALWNSTQNYNTGLGPRSLYTLATGSENIAIGHSALEYLSSASNNISIGGYSGWNLTTGSNNIVVGYSASASSATVSNEITLGDSNITKFRVPGLSIDWDKDIEIMSIMGAY